MEGVCNICSDYDDDDDDDDDDGDQKVMYNVQQCCLYVVLQTGLYR